jgi:hypothetical protein
MSEYKLGQVCEHGRLARSCDECWHVKEIARLTAELANARQLISDHCDDEEKVRAILKEFDKSDSHGSDGPIELAERAAESLRQARADRDVLAANVKAWRRRDVAITDWKTLQPWGRTDNPQYVEMLAATVEVNDCDAATDASGALTRAGGGE